MKKLSLIILSVVFISSLLVAQDTDKSQGIDASKPTNFYNLLENNLEYNSRKDGGNLMGYRAQGIFVPDEKLLILTELPLLYNDKSEKFGLGDIRGRVFYLPYKDYSQFFGAFGPSIDIFAPTGNYEDGLGSSSWVVMPGIMAGLMITDWLQAFPIISYSYTSKPITDAIPDAQKETGSGITLQAIIPVVFNEDFFIQVTPIYSMDLKTSENSAYRQEIMGQYAISKKVQMVFFYGGTFKFDDHVTRLGAVIYL